MLEFQWFEAQREEKIHVVCVRFAGFFISPLLMCSQVHMVNVATVILENTPRATASSRIVISDVCRSVEIQPESEGS